MTQEKIRHLNDCLRKTGLNGKVMLTQGVQALGEEAILQIMILMQCYDDFPEENDPYGEHDFGSIKFDEKKLFWKIDYYDHAYQMGSSNPADPNVTRRVLTLMLASEY